MHVLENEQPSHQPRRQWRLPRPGATTEPNRPARKPQSISAASPTSGWRRLMISSRARRNKSSWRSSRGWLMAAPLTANLAVEEITNRTNPESRNARKQQPTTGFLAKSNTCSGQITAMVQSLPNSSRATTYVVDDVVHYSATNIPGAVAPIATFALS